MNAFIEADRLGIRETRAVALLLAVHAEPGHSAKHYAAALRINKPSTTRAHQRLQALGLVTVQADPSNKRLIVITTTTAGRRAAVLLSQPPVRHSTDRRDG